VPFGEEDGGIAGKFVAFSSVSSALNRMLTGAPARAHL
jgi:hypothetical protein